MKPFSQACENNKIPILIILQKVFRDVRRVLEIGSGTGQHAAFIGPQLPHLVWQTSDLKENHAGIKLWLQDEHTPNVRAPIHLDVDMNPWPEMEVDGVFTANTLHIVSESQVKRMIEGVGRLLPTGAPFCIYGPFNYNGAFTSDSNAGFDIWLKARNPLSGIRDYETIKCVAEENGLSAEQDHAMPANNRLLVWRKN